MIEVKHNEGLSEMLRKASDELLSPANPKEDADPFLAAVLLAAERFIDLQWTEIASLRVELVRARKSPAPAVVEIDAEPGEGGELDSKIATPGPAKHRHVFGADGRCTKCGKVKAAGGRPTASIPSTGSESPYVDARTLPLPVAPRAPLRDVDEFTDGTFGGSGVTRR